VDYEVVTGEEPHLERTTSFFKGNIFINGPGSGHILSDDLFINSPIIPKWTSTKLVSLWKNNVNHAFRCLGGEPFDEIGYSPDNADTAQLLKELPNDWIFRQFKEYKVRERLGPAPLSDDIYSHVNLVGWGRGAVSCHMLANLMKNDSKYCHIPINILAIDPVTGTLNPEPDQITLGSNVKEYVGLYARDERSANLPCIIPDTAQNTLVHIYPIAGRHTTVIGNQAADGANKPGSFSEPADLVYYLALRCLNRWNPTWLMYQSVSLGYAGLSLDGNPLLLKIKSEYDDYINMRNTTYSNQSQDVNGDREILLNGQLTNFKSAKGNRFTPAHGLSKGHIEDMSYFQDIT
jgi:hypothetical protein